MHDLDQFLPGDKVRMRAGPRRGMRGAVRSAEQGLLAVVLSDGSMVTAHRADITNLSLAARKAWQTMPKRAGRPRDDSSHRKRMVSLRIDADLWEDLRHAAQAGLIRSREQAVNNWIREQLQLLHYAASADLDARNREIP